MWKIIALVMAIGAAVGYFKYTQDKMAELIKNQQKMIEALMSVSKVI